MYESLAAKPTKWVESHATLAERYYPEGQFLIPMRAVEHLEAWNDTLSPYLNAPAFAGHRSLRPSLVWIGGMRSHPPGPPCLGRSSLQLGATEYSVRDFCLLENWGRYAELVKKSLYLHISTRDLCPRTCFGFFRGIYCRYRQ